MIPDSSFPLKDTTIRIPSRGLGTFQPNPKVYPEGSVKLSVLDALKAGYRHIDTALDYGNGDVERGVGEAIKEAGILREDLFIVTKLENVYHNPEDVEKGIDASLKNLGLEYVDLYLMHFPYAYTKTEGFGKLRHPDGKPVIDVPLSRAFDRTYAAMEELVYKGKTKLIGISNFSTPKIKRLLQTARIRPAVNQIEVHAHFPQKGLVHFCHENNIHVTAFGPLGCTPIPALVGRTGPGPLDDPTVAAIAKKYDRTPAQVLLCYLLLRGISVIPKSNNQKRIYENFDCIFDLTEEDFKTIDSLKGVDGEHGVRGMEPKEYLGFDNYNEEVEEP